MKRWACNDQSSLKDIGQVACNVLAPMHIPVPSIYITNSHHLAYWSSFLKTKIETRKTKLVGVLVTESSNTHLCHQGHSYWHTIPKHILWNKIGTLHLGTHSYIWSIQIFLKFEIFSGMSHSKVVTGLVQNTNASPYYCYLCYCANWNSLILRVL